MNEREQFIDQSILEIIYDNVNSPFRWKRVCDYIESRPDIEWGRDVLPSFRRLGLLGRYYYDIKKKVDALELEAVWEDFQKANRKIWENVKSPDIDLFQFNHVEIRKGDDCEEKWKNLVDYNSVAFVQLESVDIERLLSYAQLERLVFQSIKEVKNLHLLEQMPNLKWISFSNIRKVTSAKEKLSLNQVRFDTYIRKEDDSEETWNSLWNYNKIHFLKLASVDIGRLLPYPQLERLDFDSIKEVKNLHLLEQMPNLKSLSFSDIRKVTSDKGKLSLNLERFQCSNPQITKSILPNSKMKILSLDHMDTILDLQTIGSLDTLEKLYLDRITKVIHPEALIKAKNLRELRLFVIRPGDDWSVIKELPLLHTLEFNAEPTLKESLSDIILSHPWMTIDPNFSELTITTLNYLETYQNIDVYERVNEKCTTYCVFGDFSNQIKDKNNETLGALVKEQIKRKKIKTKYLFDCEAGMFSVDSPTLEGAYQLTEVINELLMAKTQN